LDSRGCHNDRQRGEYHCHRGPLSGKAFGSASEAIEAMAKLQGAAPAAPAAKPAAPAATRSGAPSIFAPAAAPAAAASVCDSDRRGFEALVSLRMQNYESTGDSWSARAARWRTEIAANVAAGKPTAALDAAYGRFSRYCTEGDSFMAGMVVG
jgi:hypothetical protein